MRFWRAPYLNQLHSLSTLYFKLKGIVFYRLVFQRFGSGSYIRNPLLILNSGCISIGDRVAIREGARLEVVRSNQNHAPQMIIENDTSIEQNVHIVCHCRVRIGSNVSITGNCAIVDIAHPFSDIRDPRKIGARIAEEESFVEIGDGSFIGFGSVILPNVKIGTHVVIGANSVVTRDIPDYSVAAGVPAVVLKRYDFERQLWMNVCATSPSPVHGS
jgi:acetyltransferase-like isoleucine patch superfamily enzyme